MMYGVDSYLYLSGKNGKRWDFFMWHKLWYSPETYFALYSAKMLKLKQENKPNLIIDGVGEKGDEFRPSSFDAQGQGDGRQLLNRIQTKLKNKNNQSLSKYFFDLVRCCRLHLLCRTNKSNNGFRVVFRNDILSQKRALSLRCSHH
jgi:hypothetical protein